MEEGVGGEGEGVAFDFARRAVLEDEEAELAEVGDEDLVVVVEIAKHLRGSGELVQLRLERLSFQGAAGGFLTRKDGGGGALDLAGGEEACLRKSGARVLEMNEAMDLGLERLADRVEKVGERRVVGGFGDTGAQVTDGTELGQVLGENGHGMPS